MNDIDSGQGAMPAVFLGHGNPLNAIENTRFSNAWRALAASLPRPRAILAVSAHWYVPGVRVTSSERPRTVHDFSGFPRRLYEVTYPARGSPELARRVVALLAAANAEPDAGWGLDHGTWSLLVHMYPKHEVPVVQLSLDARLSGPEHFELARRLAPLRGEGVLVLGSGNAVHNLGRYAWDSSTLPAYDWAVRFETRLRSLTEARDFAALATYEQLGPDAMLAAPTPDHFLPLLYVLAQANEGDTITFPVEGFDGGSISMLGVRVG